MTQGQQWFIIFVLLYVVECLVWVGPRTWVFLSGWWGRWKRFDPQPGAVKGRALLCEPLPPMGWGFLAEAWPLSLTAEGAGSRVLAAPNPGRRPPLRPGFCRWEERRLPPHAALSTRTQAAVLRTLTQELAEAPESARGELIDAALRESMDVEAARAAYGRFRAETAGLRDLLNWGAFPFFLGVVPFAYWRAGQTLPFFVTLGAACLLLLVAAVMFWRLHRRLWPERSEERWQQTAFVALVPPHGLRSPQYFAREWLAGFHPLAVAAAVLPREKLEVVAGRFWRDAVHPLPAASGLLSEDREDGSGESVDAAEQAAHDFHQRHYRPALEACLRQAGLEPEALEQPPAARAGAASFCPRCHQLFTRPEAVCADCDGLGAVPLARSARPGGG